MRTLGTRRKNRGQRGYVMLIVIVVLLILVSAVAYSFKAIQNEIRAGSRFRKSEMLVRAAEAGAAVRLSEIALTNDAQVIIDTSNPPPSAAAWNDYPPAGTFTSNNGNADYGDMGPQVQYRTTATLVWSGKVPPPGVPLGTNTYVFQITSYAVERNSSASLNIFDEGGEAAVDVGVKTWDPLPGTYSP